MVTVEQASEQAREPLFRAVRQREQVLGSRMDAYSAVGSAIGRSASWVRKVIGRSPDVTIGLHDWININAICSRLDAASERLEASTAAREERRAIAQANEVVEQAGGRDPAGNGLASARLTQPADRRS